MKNIFSACMMCLVIMLCMIETAIAAPIDMVVNISGQTNMPDVGAWNPIVITLDPGTYNFTPVQNPSFAQATNPYEGALYNGAYSFYGTSAWTSAYRIAINDRAHMTVYGDETPVSTISDAFTHAVGGSFTITEESNILFGVGDSYYGDNSGGISLHLTSEPTPTPVPATIFLMASGLAGLIGSFKKRKKNYFK